MSQSITSLPLASVSAFDGLMLVIAVLFVLLCWYAVWRLWRGRDVRDQPRNPYSHAQQDRMRRMLPSGTVCVTAAVIAVTVGELYGQRTLTEKIIVGVFAVIAFSAGGVAFSVDLRDRPRWAIPPVLRDKERVLDPSVGPAGALVLRAARRRQRRRHPDDRPADPAPTPPRESTSDEWLDPDTKEWLDRHMRETRP